MRVVDTSAVVAVLFNEPSRAEIETVLLEEACVMSAATRVELGIVIEAKTGPAGSQLLEEFLSRINMEIVPVDAQQAADAVVCWRRFGKGRHAAGLNFGDTFTYTLARRLGHPLLFVGDDFAQTDLPAITGDR
ncbi:MAG: type II toxin-antitoxin system VapC family toxin [Euzebya sp.]